MSAVTELLQPTVPAEKLLDSLPVGVELANTKGQIVFSNAAARRILGPPPPSHLPPEGWSDHFAIYLPDGVTPFPADDFTVVRALRGEYPKDVEMVVRLKGKEEVRVSASAQPLLTEDGEQVGAASVFRDVTELRRVELLKDELAAFVVHDLKSPVAAILTLCSLLSSDRADDPGLLEDLQTIEESAQRVNRMILDLMDIQMAKGGALEPAYSRFPALDILRQAAEASKARLGRAARQSIELEEVDCELMVHGDHDLLFRVLMNLIDNCIKYGPPNGVISLSAKQEPSNTLLIAVRDEGPGVPQHLRERIFEKYARLERSGERSHRDSRGLGLRFCRTVAEAHGGSIWVEDAKPMGARFCLQLPA